MHYLYTTLRCLLPSYCADVIYGIPQASKHTCADLDRPCLSQHFNFPVVPATELLSRCFSCCFCLRVVRELLACTRWSPSSHTSSSRLSFIGRRLNGFLGLSWNDRTILFLLISLDRTVSVGWDSLCIRTLASCRYKRLFFPRCPSNAISFLEKWSIWEAESRPGFPHFLSRIENSTLCPVQ